MDFWPQLTSGIIHVNAIVILDPKNIAVAVGILSLILFRCRDTLVGIFTQPNYYICTVCKKNYTTIKLHVYSSIKTQSSFYRQTPSHSNSLRKPSQPTSRLTLLSVSHSNYNSIPYLIIILFFSITPHIHRTIIRLALSSHCTLCLHYPCYSFTVIYHDPLLTMLYKP